MRLFGRTGKGGQLEHYEWVSVRQHVVALWCVRCARDLGKEQFASIVSHGDSLCLPCFYQGGAT